MKSGVLPILVCLLSATLNTQQGVPKPPWSLYVEDVIPITIPAVVRAEVTAELDYDASETVRGVVYDLNDDRIHDYIVQSARRLCGTGGCPYSIVDGASKRTLGGVFGNPIYVRAEKTHGYLVIETYGHLSVDSGNFMTYNFDGTGYIREAHRFVEGASLRQLFAKMAAVPRWRPVS